MRSAVQLCLAANNILLMRKRDHASRIYSLKNKLGDRMIKQLLNSVIAKYRNLSVSRWSIICRGRIIDLLATDKSRYFAQPRPIIVNYWHTLIRYEDWEITCEWESLRVTQICLPSITSKVTNNKNYWLWKTVSKQVFKNRKCNPFQFSSSLSIHDSFCNCCAIYTLKLSERLFLPHSIW